MYSLVVWEALGELTDRTFSVGRQRFLEYTDADIKDKLEPLSAKAVEALKAWPILLMTEGQTDEEAHVVFAESIQRDSKDVTVCLRPGSLGPILNEQVWKLRRELDIAEWEFTRSHWAVKRADLPSVLSSVGFLLPDDFSSLDADVRLAPSRAELIALRDQISEWTHREIDDLVTLAGVDGLDAPRAAGSRADRAGAILDFALANPGAMTAERRLFSTFLEEQVEEHPKKRAPEGTVDSAPPTRDPRRVFVVHGRDESVKASVVQYLRALGLEPVVLHEQANMGRHLLTKFMEEAELATFAVVLMTADDTGGLDAARLRPRARQNVILELGYFLSRLGQQSVCALVTPGLETPSDFDGIVYVPVDPSGAWRSELRRELVAAKLPVRESKGAV